MKKINEKQLDRIRGALYGVAVGDALGGPLEFMSDQQIRTWIPCSSFPTVRGAASRPWGGSRK